MFSNGCNRNGRVFKASAHMQLHVFSYSQSRCTIIHSTAVNLSKNDLNKWYRKQILPDLHQPNWKKHKSQWGKEKEMEFFFSCLGNSVSVKLNTAKIRSRPKMPEGTEATFFLKPQKHEEGLEERSFYIS